MGPGQSGRGFQLSAPGGLLLGHVAYSFLTSVSQPFERKDTLGLWMVAGTGEDID